LMLILPLISVQQRLPEAAPTSSVFPLKDVLPAQLVVLLKEDRLLAGSSMSGQDDPDGCCIQSNGSSKSCSKGIKKKQCYDDCEATGCKADWHAGACSSKDGCD